MTKDEALARIANHLAGHLHASELADLNIHEDEESEADIQRLEWAIEEVARRLDRMGKGGRS